MLKTILIVEDEALVATDLKFKLEDLGYEVIGTVATGDEAIYTAVEFRPDLTIMDINLKGDMSGIDAAKRILALDLAVVYLTANSDSDTFDEANLSPASAFIQKPFDIKKLSRVIELAINRQKIESEKVNLARGIVDAPDNNSDESNVSDEFTNLIDSPKLNNSENIGEKISSSQSSESLTDNFRSYLTNDELQIEAKKEYESSNKIKSKRFDKIKSEEFNEIVKIFIVEDEAITALDIKCKLEDFGYNVIGSADNAKDAINKLKKSWADLILVDIHLKGDMSGIELANEIKQFEIPIIYITANSDDETAFKALKTAPYGFISKPISDVDLKSTIEVAIKKYRSNVEGVISTENKVAEKNTELNIEKSNVFIILLSSSALIIAGIFSRNITWLQWVLFIPAVIMVFLAIASLKKQAPVKQWEIPPFVSILVPAHNEEFSIASTVESLANINYKYLGKTNYELIIINDGSEDRTAEVLANLKNIYPHLKIITRVPPRSGKGKGFVLNDGLEIAKGEIIAVFDADAKVESEFLNIIVPYLNDPNVQGVQCRVKMYNKDENFLTFSQHVEFACFGNTVRAKDILGKAGFLGGNGQLAKKKAIYDSGCWDGFAITEDLNLSVKLMLNGYAIRYCGETAVYQEAITNWRALFRQRSRWAIGNFETLFIYLTKILASPMPVFRMFGLIEHVAFYGLNMLVFFGFIVFAINMVSWFVFHGVTIIRMDAPLIVGIISAFGFFPGAIITLFRDHKGIFNVVKGTLYYWLYSFHLIPLFFMTLGQMLVRKERTWSKTVHNGSKEEK